jgi:hypothetical protein
VEVEAGKVVPVICAIAARSFHWVNRNKKMLKYKPTSTIIDLIEMAVFNQGGASISTKIQQHNCYSLGRF